MSEDDFFKLPRLFVDAPLGQDAEIPLSAEQAHYFKTVLRRQDGDNIRLFNGRDGEWLAVLTALGKKDGTAAARRQLKDQPTHQPRVHLFFAPIKKSRLDWLVEKAVELGVTDLHPVITQNTEIREVNGKRLTQQIFEAAEQCERLDLPVLHETVRLPGLAAHVPAGAEFFACLERGDTRPLNLLLNDVPRERDVAVLVGPEGGFTAAEASMIFSHGTWRPASLGPRILRCETAVCVALTAIMLHQSA